MRAIDSSDTETLSNFVREHQAAVWRYLRVLGCQPDQADDLTQEVFLAALKRPVVSASRSRARRYLLAAARNKLTNANRRTLVHERAIQSIRDRPFRIDPMAESDQWVSALRVCLGHLVPRARRTLERRYRDGLRGADIAMELGVAEEHVNTIVHRAKAQLRRCIEARIRAEVKP